MKSQPLLKDVMTPFPYAVDVDVPVDEAVRLMREHKIRHVPVTEKGALKGLVSDRDIKLMLGPDFAYPNPRELRVRDAMVEEYYAVDRATPLRSVLEHMADRHIGSAVVTRNGELIGMFTSTDACRAFAQYLAATEPLQDELE